jgi:hypothetical protein
MQTNANYSKQHKPAKQQWQNEAKQGKGNKPAKHDKREYWKGV